MAKKNSFKPHKGLLKRVRRTGTGKFKMRHAGMGHLLSTKSGKRRRKLRGTMIAPLCEEKRLRRMLEP